MDNLPVLKIQGQAAQILESRARELLCEGPSGTSKTTSILYKIMLCCIKYAGCRCLILRKTRTSLSSTTLATFKNLFGDYYIFKDGGKNSHRQSFDFHNGSTILLGGLEDNPDRFLSADLDLVYCSEATECNEEDFRPIWARLRNGAMRLNNTEDYKLNPGNYLGVNTTTPYHQIIYDCNPTMPTHWLNIRFSLPEEEMQQLGRQRLKVKIESNPKFWDVKTNDFTEEGKIYINTLSATQDALGRKRFIDGEWCQAANLVYDEWTRDNIIEPIDTVAQKFRHYVGLDFGWTLGAATLFALSDDDTAYIVGEWLYAKKQLGEWVQILTNIRDNYGVIKIICDSAEPRSIDYLKQNGLPAVAVVKGPDSVKNGIKIIKNRIHNKQLFIFKNSVKAACPIILNDDRYRATPKNLVEEFACYQMDLTKDEPISEFNHLLDSLRYGLSTVERSKFNYSFGGKDNQHQKPDGAGDDWNPADEFGWQILKV